MLKLRVRRYLGCASLATVVCLATSCAVVKSKQEEVRNKGEKLHSVYWPAPPEQPRFKFIGILRSAKDVMQESDDARLKRKLTGEDADNERPVIDRPSGIAVRSGMVYVAEPSAKAITVFDMPRRKLFRFGLREPNNLKHPQAIAVDREGLVYVLDTALQKIMIFDQIGLFLHAIDLKDGFTHPVAVAVNPDGKTIYVVDRGDLGNNDHKIVAYSPSGKELFRIGPRGEADGKLNIPLAATVAGNNTLLVADSGNFRVQAFDPSGKFKFSFGAPGSEPGNFSRPRSIAVDSGGRIYVADAGFNNVQIFNEQGQLLMPLGALKREPGPANYALLAGIAVDEGGRLYVVDHYFKKIEVFLPITDDEGRKLTGTPP